MVKRLTELGIIEGWLSCVEPNIRYAEAWRSYHQFLVEGLRWVEHTIQVEQAAHDVYELTVSKGADERAITGRLGLGRAAWAARLHRPQDLEARPRPEALPLLTPEVAPLGRDLRPMPVPLSAEAATRYAVEQEADGDPLWFGPTPRIHPGWLAARCTPFIHHSYDYGPAIHTRSQIQHLAPAHSGPGEGQTLVVAGTFVETFERKGHHYGVVDCLIRSEDGVDLAQIRHTTIYQVAKRPAPAG